MFTVELYARIRRAVMADGLSRREAAKQFGVHRNTIAKMLQFSIPPGYRRRVRRYQEPPSRSGTWPWLSGGRFDFGRSRQTGLRSGSTSRKMKSAHMRQKKSVSRALTSPTLNAALYR